MEEQDFPYSASAFSTLYRRKGNLYMKNYDISRNKRASPKVRQIHFMVPVTPL
jgi:hypothetical protein